MANQHQEDIDRNKSSVRRLADELSHGNLAVFDAVMGPGYIGHKGMDTLTLEDVRSEYRALLNAFPDGSWTIELLLAAENDSVVAQGTFRGMQAAPYIGIGAAGQHVAVPFFWIYRFSGDRAREGWALRDDLALVQQIGGTITPE